jgi:hypothetical protein
VASLFQLFLFRKACFDQKESSTHVTREELKLKAKFTDGEQDENPERGKYNTCFY